MRQILISLILCITPFVSLAEDGVVARVNGAAITERELDAEVNRLIPKATYHGNVSEEKRKEFLEKALENLINQELQFQDAVAKGLKPDKKQVKERMELIRKRFKSKKDYKTALEQEGITEDELRSRVEKGLLALEAVSRMVTEPSRMSDAALRDYYDKNTSKFKQPESVRLRIFSAKDEAKAKDALAKIQAGEDFGNVAASMSEDDYRIKGGDLGYLHKGRIYPELEDAAEKMKNGEVSNLIMAEGKWFIIKVEDKKQERQLSFEESKDKLRKELEKKKSEERMEKWLTDLRAQAKIENLLKLQ